MFKSRLRFLQHVVLRSYASPISRPVHIAQLRLFSTEKATEKPLFCLDIDLDRLDDFESKNNPSINASPLDTRSDPDSSNDKATNDILADFLQKPDNETPTPLDQILANLANDDYSDLKPHKEEPQDQFGSNVEDSQTTQNAIEKEQDLFKSIFSKYSNDMKPSFWAQDLSEQVLTMLKESFSQPSPSSLSDETKRPRSRAIPKVLEAEKLLSEMENMTAHALLGTTEWLSSKSRSELMLFYQDLFERFKNDDYNKETFVLKKHRNESDADLMERLKALCQIIEDASRHTPEQPVLTSQALPALFNFGIKTFVSKFYDGAAALTMFNLAKEDLALYAVLCNQATYNEMLKVYWLFYGKASLYEVELMVVEMVNNGFKGDLETFAILRKILLSYHTMRMGKTVYNPGGSPIWSAEDERRAANLGMKLQQIGARFAGR